MASRFLYRSAAPLPPSRKPLNLRHLCSVRLDDSIENFDPEKRDSLVKVPNDPDIIHSVVAVIGNCRENTTAL